MRIHLLRHGTLNDHVTIGEWAEKMGHSVSKTVLIDNENLPRMKSFNWLIILGGIMDTHEEDKYPWLVEEKKFIKDAINQKKIVLGICFGAQLIAEALGAKVYKNKYKEIGWHKVNLTEDGNKSPVFIAFPDRFPVFQWHDYIFDLPPGAVRTAENEACANQAFVYKERVIGVQFHLEFSEECIRTLVREYGDKITEGKYIQPKEEILTERRLIGEIDELKNLLLKNIEKTFDDDYD